jgi:3-oxoacyl-[acyl-carrier-protein] synthase II
VYAEVKGSGWSCDAYHATAPEPSGASIIRALERALDEARAAPEEIDCVIPHGTGTALNDVVESRILAEVFEDRVGDLLVCAIKSMVGHGGGAAGAFSVLTAAMILDRGVVPPTANLRELDAECALRPHRGKAIEARVRNVLVNAYAFGGNNISLILGRADGN